MIMSSVDKDIFTSSISMLVFPFYCLVTQASISNTILYTNGENGHPCLFPNYFTLSMMLDIFYQVEEVHCITNLLEIFIMNEC